MCGVVGSVYDPTFTISHFFSFYVCTRVQSSKADHSGKIFYFYGPYHKWSSTVWYQFIICHLFYEHIWISVKELDPTSPKPLARVFLLLHLWILNYYVKSSSNNLSIQNIKTGVSSETVDFGTLIYILSWRQHKQQCLCFHYWGYLTNFWRNTWLTIHKWWSRRTLPFSC